MIALNIFKSLFLGIGWACAFYTFMGFLLIYFPLPQMMAFRKFMVLRTKKLIKKENDSADSFWERSVKWMRVLTWLLFLGTLFFFGWTLFEIMGQRMEFPAGELFWVYYSVAFFAAMAFLWIVAKHFYKYMPKTPWILKK